MIVTEVIASHSMKLSIPNTKYGMAEFYSCRKAQVENGENPGLVYEKLSLACRSDVLRAMARNGTPYITGYGDVTSDAHGAQDKNYVRIGQENAADARVSILLADQRAKAAGQAPAVPHSPEPPVQAGKEVQEDALTTPATPVVEVPATTMVSTAEPENPFAEELSTSPK